MLHTDDGKIKKGNEFGRKYSCECCADGVKH